MHTSTKKSCLSVLSACCLLVGPAAIYRVGYNFYEAARIKPQADRERTNPEIWERNLRCDSARAIQDKAAGSSPSAPHTPIIYPDVSREPDAGLGLVSNDQTPVGAEAFLDSQYNTATKEIGERLGTESLLFGLKFTLVGGIMAVLFSLIGRKNATGMDFERFIQKRRVGVFFVAALLCSAIVDTRLRFNAKVIESLGDWVWCVERYKGAAGARVIGFPTFWEHFLHLQLDAGSHPILRYFCHFLTALLYAVTLYLFIVMPRTMNRSNKTMLTQGGRLFFVLLFFVSVSYCWIARNPTGDLS